MVLPCLTAAATREQKENRQAGSNGDGDKTQAFPPPALERLVTMQLLQAGLPDGPAAKAPTKCFVLVQGPRGGGGNGRGEEATPRHQPPSSSSSSFASFLSSQQPPSPPPGFLPAAGFSWTRASSTRGMTRVRIEVAEFEGGDGTESEMEWQRVEGAATTGAAAAREGQGAGAGAQGAAEEGGVWWASTATISGVAGCSGA